MSRPGAVSLPRLRGRSLTQVMRSALEGRDVEAAEERALCSIDELRRVYEEQAARGIPEAVEGLARIEQGLWPSSGKPMTRRPEARKPADGA